MSLTAHRNGMRDATLAIRQRLLTLAEYHQAAATEAQAKQLRESAYWHEIKRAAVEEVLVALDSYVKEMGLH